jgi:chromatin segregation and condensation protein Rec8/ScpA/Scc1 (kleisin family)
MLEPQYRLEGIVRTRSEEMEDFEGPLDVIVLLLSKNKIEIQDVSITAILEQYLAYLEEMKRLDMEIASEFITMASHLMLIKTKMLLSAAEQAEAESELDLIRQSLLERQRKEAMEGIRQAITILEPRNEIGRCMFVKEPEPLRKDKTYRYKHDPIDLLKALDTIAERSARRLEKLVVARILARPDASHGRINWNGERLLLRIDRPALVVHRYARVVDLDVDLVPCDASRDVVRRLCVIVCLRKAVAVRLRRVVLIAQVLDDEHLDTADRRLRRDMRVGDQAFGVDEAELHCWQV